MVFTGGIGANSPEIRARICEGLDYLGLVLHEKRNAHQQRVISAPDSPVQIEAFPTDEECVIARHTRDVLGATRAARKAQAHG